MRGIINKFKQCKNKLVNMVQSYIIDSIKNTIEEIWGYGQKGTKDKINSLKFLAILDDKNYLIQKDKIKWSEYILKLGVLLIIICLLIIISRLIIIVFWPKKNLLESTSPLLIVPLVFLMTVLVFSIINFWVLFILFLCRILLQFILFISSWYPFFSKLWRRLILFISRYPLLSKLWRRLILFISQYLILSTSMFIYAYCITHMTVHLLSDEKDSIMHAFFREYCVTKFAWHFWLIITAVFIGSCLSLYMVLNFVLIQDSFDLEAMGTENRFIIAFLAIITFVIGIDLDKVRPIAIGLLLLVIQTTFFEWYHSHRLSKLYEKAQQIFEIQLLSNNPDYEELKKCYYYGGEKYKEKLLSTEKFLQLIKKREVYNINYKRRGLRSRRRK